MTTILSILETTGLKAKDTSVSEYQSEPVVIQIRGTYEKQQNALRLISLHRKICLTRAASLCSQTLFLSNVPLSGIFADKCFNYGNNVIGGVLTACVIASVCAFFVVRKGFSDMEKQYAHEMQREFGYKRVRGNLDKLIFGC
ncbi:MAG: hypothetical protein H0X29_06995 [Parachlamydiaceae bacterium]|nr:hypothetical protein [Parachlamydiaceae bacterium]